MMRSARSSCFVALAGIVVGIALAPARPAAACWGCWDPAWFSVLPGVEESIPRDGVVAFYLSTAGSGCADELWSALEIEVWTQHEGERVAGTATYDGDLVIFRPEKPFTAGHRIGARARIGDALPDPTDTLYCGDPVREAEVELEITDEASIPPPPPPPSIEIEAWPLLDSLADLACCPEATPVLDENLGCGGEVLWSPEGACTPTHRQTVHTFVGLRGYEAPTIPRGQLIHRLLVDGEVADRSIWTQELRALRTGPACAIVEIEHLGTGEVLRSPEVCTSAETAAALGVHPTDLAATLGCDAPMSCAADAGRTWDPAACVPVDADDLPPPSGLIDDTPTATPCAHEARALPGTAAPGGCGIASSGPGALLLVVFAGLRRRRRALPRACAGAGLP